MSALSQSSRPTSGRGGSFDVARTGYVIVVGLLVEFVLGLATNLWVTVGHTQPWSHISDPALAGVHGLVGLALTMMAFVVVGRTHDQSGAVRIWAIVSLVGMLVALFCGLEFISSGAKAGWSFGMGLAWAVALMANAALART